MPASVIGLAGVKSALEAVFGPLDVQPLSSQIYGFYTALVYLTPIFGGLLADRVLGQRRTVVVGAILMAIGHFMMAVEQLFLFALLALILGNGAFKPNISTQVGGLYAPGDRRRDRAYSIFYVGINVGAFLAPLVCGTLGEEAGWHYGFAAAGVGMLIGLAIYLYAMPLLPADELQKAKAVHVERTAARSQRMARRYRDPGLVRSHYACSGRPTSSGGNTIALVGRRQHRPPINLLGLTAEIPTTWFQAFNPFMIFAFTPFVVALWTRQAARGAEPSTISKMALGCFGVALVLSHHGDGRLAYAARAKRAGCGCSAFFVVITIGELYLSPVGLSLVTKIAPARILSMMMGVWLATSFIGDFLAGWLGSFWSRMEKPEFFLLIAAIAALAGAAIYVTRRPLKGALRE